MILGGWVIDIGQPTVTVRIDWAVKVEPYWLLHLSLLPLWLLLLDQNH